MRLYMVSKTREKRNARRCSEEVNHVGAASARRRTARSHMRRIKALPG
jgi:hypothetical protein